MENSMKSIFILFIVLIYCSMTGFSQEKDSLFMGRRLNSISFNPTSMILCNNLKNLTFVYERMLKPNQSLVIQLGYLEVNPVLLDSINVDGSISLESNNGLNAAIQYRYYPARLNAQPAPFGLYIGPYASYYGLSTIGTYSVSDSDPSQSSEIRTNYNMLNMGIGIGYQFVFKERFSIDLLAFGPSFTYSFKNKKSTDPISENDEAMVSDLVEGAYSSEYPLLGQFIKINGNASSASLSMFFRYSISVGYRF